MLIIGANLGFNGCYSAALGDCSLALNPSGESGHVIVQWMSG